MSRAAILVPLLILIATSQALAAIRSWDGGGDATSWGDAANWDPDGVPSNNFDHVFVINGGTIDIGGVNRDRGGPTTNLIVGTTITNTGPNAGTASAASLRFQDNTRRVEVRDSTFDKSLRLNFSAATSLLVSNCTIHSRTDGNMLFTVVGGGLQQIIGGEFKGFANGDHVEIIAQFAGQDHTIEVIGGNHDFDDFRINSRNGSTAHGHGILRLSNTTIRCGTSGTPKYHDSTTLTPASSDSTSTIFDHASVTRFDSHLVFGTQCTYRASGQTRLRFRSATSNKNIDIRMTNQTFFDGEGLIVNIDAENNSETELEVCSEDVGAFFAGFHDNYSFDELRFTVSPAALGLTLEDNRDNSPGAGSEAIYTDLIAVYSNVTIVDGGLKIYYKSLFTTNGHSITGGTLVQVTGAVLSVADFIYAPDQAGTVNYLGATLSVSNDYGTVFVSGVPSNRPVQILMDVSGPPQDIAALKTELGASGTGGEFNLRIPFPGVANGEDLFFDWSFSHRNVTLNRLAVTKLVLGAVFNVR